MRRRDRLATHLAVAGVLLAGLGLLWETVGPTQPPAPAVSSAAPAVEHAGRIDVPEPASADRPSDAPAARAVTATPAGDGAVRRAEPLPVRHVTADPDRIVVPGLGVDAPVVPVSATGGVLTPPADPTVIGWWAAGARPGASVGTAILTGHTVSSGGGAFDDLDRMHPGQRLRIGAGRSALDYVVRSVTVYPKQSLAEHAGAIFDQDVPGRVALVTCEDWNGSAYLSNAVVIAEPAR